MAFTDSLTARLRRRKTKEGYKANGQGGNLSWKKKSAENLTSSQHEQTPDSTPDWRVRGRELERDLEEQREIREVRDGIRSGPSAFMTGIIEDSRPLPLPEGVEVSSFSGEDLNVALKLGILTMDSITQSQRKLYEEVPNRGLTPAAVADLLSKIVKQANTAVKVTEVGTNEKDS